MRTILRVTGYIVAATGIIGLAAPTALGAHVGLFHNMFHICAGALAVYFSRKGDIQETRSFCVLFGLGYLLVGGSGYAFGVPGSPAGMLEYIDPRLFRVIPGYLEFGRMDHFVHVLTGAACFIGGMRTRQRMPLIGVRTPARGRVRETAIH